MIRLNNEVTKKKKNKIKLETRNTYLKSCFTNS